METTHTLLHGHFVDKEIHAPITTEQKNPTINLRIMNPTMVGIIGVPSRKRVLIKYVDKYTGVRPKYSLSGARSIDLNAKPSIYSVNDHGKIRDCDGEDDGPFSLR